MVCLCGSQILHRGAPGQCQQTPKGATEYSAIFKVNTVTSARLHTTKLFGTNCLLMERSGISSSLGALQSITGVSKGALNPEHSATYCEFGVAAAAGCPPGKRPCVCSQTSLLCIPHQPWPWPRL